MLGQFRFTKDDSYQLQSMLFFHENTLNFYDLCNTAIFLLRIVKEFYYRNGSI